MEAKTKKFLDKFYKILKEDFWGDIEPEWFEPDIDGLSGEEKEWAEQLHQAVEKALKEIS